MGLVIKVARNRGWVNGTDVDASRSQLNAILAAKELMYDGGTIQRTKRRWLASSRRRSENDAALQIFHKHSAYKRCVICIADVALHS